MSGKLTQAGGSRLHVLGIVSAALTAILGAWVEGIAIVIDSIAQAWIVAPLQGFAEWTASLVSMLLEIPGVALASSTASSAAFAANFGAFSVVVGVVFALAMGYIVAQVTNYV